MTYKTKYSVLENAKYMISHMHRADKSAILLAVVYVFPSVMATLMSTLLLKMLIGILENGADLTKIIQAVGVFVLFSSIFTVAKNFLETRHSVINTKYRLYCQTLIIEKNMRIPYEKIESRENRKLLDKANEFVAYSGRGACATATILRDLATDLVGVFSVCTVFLAVDIRLVAMLILVGVCTFLLYSRESDNEKSYQDKNVPITKKTMYLAIGKPTEIKAAKDIRIFNISSWFSPLIDILIGERADIINSFLKKNLGLLSADALIILLREGVTVYFLISNVLKGRITVSDFVFYFGLLNAFSLWIRGICQGYQRTKSTCLLCDDYRIYIEQEDEENCDEPCNGESNRFYSVEFKNVCFSYDKETQVLKNISFKAEKGEKIALVGENGAGKTTCMKLLSGLYSPDSGEILLNGKHISLYPKRQLFSLFSAVFQNSLFLPVSVAENVALSVDYDKGRMKDALKKAGLTDKIETLEHGENTLLDKELNKGGTDFSGGEMQKLFLARALYKDAPIVILDEPTSALDPIAENELYLKFNSLTENKTSFYISHRLSSTRFCDRILFLKDGKITESGTHDELMALRGGYFRMYEMQSYYYREQEGAL